VMLCNKRQNGRFSVGLIIGSVRGKEKGLPRGGGEMAGL